MRRTLRTSLVALAVGALAAGCSSDAGSTADPTVDPTTTVPATTTTVLEAEAYDGEIFADLPDPIPEVPHGTLLRYQEMEDYTIDGATTYRILYRSESIQGQPTVVSGLASVPVEPAPEGGRPQLTISHGTTGSADVCAPSNDPLLTELSLAGARLGSSFLLAMTDYEGMGTPGRHPYLVGESEARATLDAITAAGQLPGADPGGQLAIAGYSQGGHGALWSAQLAPTWTPDLEVVGVFAGAPASETDLIMATSPMLGGFGLLMVSGYAEAYPDADPASVLTPEGLDLLDAVDEVCTGELFSLSREAGGAALYREGALGDAPWPDLAKANRAGTVAVDAPILVIHSTADTTVPLVFSQVLQDRLCAQGQVIERQLLEDGDGHGAAAIPAYAIAGPWIEDRFAPDGAEPVSSC